MRLLLIRHGRSAYRDTGEWVDATGAHRWLSEYDEAGIADDEAPPGALADEVAQAEYLVASDLPRAIASAERLADGRPVLQSPLLRETPVEIPGWMPLRWPVGMWETCIHLQWGYNLMRGTPAPPQEVRRAAMATKWLTRLAHDQSPIVVVTHGLFRRLLAERLVASGWRADQGWRSHRHWSAWAFRLDENGTSGNGRSK
jgi:broad specificity phosphatase PhoE